MIIFYLYFYVFSAYSICFVVNNSKLNFVLLLRITMWIFVVENYTITNIFGSIKLFKLHKKRTKNRAYTFSVLWNFTVVYCNKHPCVFDQKTKQISNKFEHRDFRITVKCLFKTSIVIPFRFHREQTFFSIANHERFLNFQVSSDWEHGLSCLFKKYSNREEMFSRNTVQMCPYKTFWNEYWIPSYLQILLLLTVSPINS